MLKHCYKVAAKTQRGLKPLLVVALVAAAFLVRELFINITQTSNTIMMASLAVLLWSSLGALFLYSFKDTPPQKADLKGVMAKIKYQLSQVLHFLIACLLVLLTLALAVLTLRFINV